MFESLNALTSIELLISAGVRESEVLEYKTSSKPFTDREKGEIAKDISAMANSLGGIIIYGVSTKRDDPTLPEAIAPISVLNIETFDRVVNSQIRPNIEGIRKRIIPTQEPRIMIVEVPQSENPPHQSLYDKKYYHRSGSESLPMEHDLVAMKFGKKLSPLLDVKFQPLNTVSNSEGDPPWSNQADLRVLIVNIGRRVARNIHLILKFPPKEVVHITEVLGPIVNADRLYSGRQARQFTENFDVYHPGTSTSIAELRFSFSQSFLAVHDSFFIEWTLYADESEPKTGTIGLGELGWLPE